jgi:hypothetical protein
MLSKAVIEHMVAEAKTAKQRKTLAEGLWAMVNHMGHFLTDKDKNLCFDAIATLMNAGIDWEEES